MSRRIDAGDFGRIAAIVVSRDGGVLFEDYFLAHGAEPPLDMKSVEKSVTALAIGIAIDEGALASVEEQVLPASADRLPHEGDLQLKQVITVRDLLAMQSVLHCDDWRDSPGNEERMYRSRRWTAFALGLPVDPRIESGPDRPPALQLLHGRRIPSRPDAGTCDRGAL